MADPWREVDVIRVYWLPSYGVEGPHLAIIHIMWSPTKSRLRYVDPKMITLTFSSLLFSFTTPSLPQKSPPHFQSPSFPHLQSPSHPFSHLFKVTFRAHPVSRFKNIVIVHHQVRIHHLPKESLHLLSQFWHIKRSHIGRWILQSLYSPVFHKSFPNQLSISELW